MPAPWPDWRESGRKIIERGQEALKKQIVLILAWHRLFASETVSAMALRSIITKNPKGEWNWNPSSRVCGSNSAQKLFSLAVVYPYTLWLPIG